ncbi:MAG: tetratricopeptide repeat protein [Dysgonamonadaceae bacterium]|nr:tetratricopeptide repeat protein [Dysgonamonadaceae bacterium]
MKRLSYFYLFLLFASSVALAAQNRDSVNRLYTDSLKHCIEYADTKQQEMELSGMLGIFYNMTGEYDSARIYLNRALNLPGGRTQEGGRLLTNLANSYGFQGRYVEALKYYIEALKVSEEAAAGRSEKDRITGKFNILRTIANISEIHYLTGNEKQAFHYAERGRELYEECVKTGNRTIAYVFPQILYVIGSVYLDRNEFDKAEKAMLETYEMADSIAGNFIRIFDDHNGMWMYVAYGKEGLARVAMARKDYALAMEHLAVALDFAERNGDQTVKAKILTTLSDVYLADGHYELSGQYAAAALKMFPGYSRLNPGAVFNIASAHLFAGDKKDAHEYFRTSAQLTKENTDKQFRETMASMEVLFETEKKELRIADLEQQKRLVIIIGVAAILLAITIWIIFRQKIRNEQKEKQLIAANAVFEGETMERERFARDLHDGVNGKLTAIRIKLAAMEDMQEIRDRIDGCIEAIRSLARDVMPVTLLRYGIKSALEEYCSLFLNVNFQFFGEDVRMDKKIELAVYYCACELVNNSVKHSGATAINVQLIQENNRISLTVEDNGCGYDKNALRQGVGLKSICDRITSINGKLDIKSSPESGTETIIELIIKRKENNPIIRMKRIIKQKIMKMRVPYFFSVKK